jgi:SAM-dependent methyltransferase
MLRKIVNRSYSVRLAINSEETFIRGVLRNRGVSGGSILDVGCGFGRFFDIANSEGLDYLGVDSNPNTVAVNRASHRRVLTDAEFANYPGAFDVLLLSHIVEHFDYAGLVSFFIRYLPRLKAGGLLVILTPLLHAGFYDDFDHVKPYNPEAIRQLLCRSTAQTQPFSIPGRYVERRIWFKRDPLFHMHTAAKWRHVLTLPSSLACALSFGLVGTLTGYGMVLERVE